MTYVLHRILTLFIYFALVKVLSETYFYFLKAIFILPSCLNQLVERSKFKKAEHLMRGEFPGLSPSKDNLLQCNKVLSCQKKNNFYLSKIILFFKKQKIYFKKLKRGDIS